MANFQTLWQNFPNETSIRSLCYHDKGKRFDNYCAIKLSEALIKSGISLGSFKGKTCWSHQGPKHALLAQQLASYLDQSPPAGFAKKVRPDPRTFRAALGQSTGVIFFKDYWRRGSGSGRESFEGRTGDHIDLWNKGDLTKFGSFTRQAGEFLGFLDSLGDSTEIWFWEVK